ncbi:MAG TPA: zf-HC2 domain-containing protein [Pyrinomonadaceae bacterium]|jgi:anti-sigma factor RsiW|nr:zf-HC2 domain-containing protein [Pyrinomonadaceae bacterium]
MLCADFEERLSDYIDGLLEADTHRMFAEHALRCPVCHETLSQVRNSIQTCRTAFVPPPSAELEAQILQRTMPETAMACDEFEDYLTDYLDGFLPAPLFHRWERHAALCAQCTKLPGEVVRSIGACYTYKGDELQVPVGLNERILAATLGDVVPAEVRAPFSSRFAAWMRHWLDPIVSPQLATVATMLLVAVFVLTNTVSADGSISGMYRASLQLAQQSGASGSGVSGTSISDGVKKFFVGGAEKPVTEPAQPPVTEDQNIDKSKTNIQKPVSAAPKAENSPKATEKNKR